MSCINEFVIDNNKTVVVRCQFQTENEEYSHLEMTVTDGSHVWFSKCSFNEIKTKHTISNYNNLLKESLERCDKEGTKYAYDFKINEKTNMATFVVKFHLKQTGLFTAAEIQLKKSEHASANMIIFKELLERNTSLETKNAKLQVKANERDDAITLSQRVIKEKDELESMLYSQFLRVLNEKKDKIRQMEQTITELKLDRDGYKKKVQEMEKSSRRAITPPDQIEPILLSPHKQTKSMETPRKRTNAASLHGLDLLDDLLADDME